MTLSAAMHLSTTLVHKLALQTGAQLPLVFLVACFAMNAFGKSCLTS